MKPWIASAAAIALLSGPALLAQGQGKGNDKGKGNGGPPAASAKANGNGGGGNAKPNRGNGNGNGNVRGNAGGNAKPDRGNGNSLGNGNGNGNAAFNRGNGNGNNTARRNNGNQGNSSASARRNDGRDGINIDVGFALPVLRQDFSADTRLIDGCPSGLAKKRNGCLPPGQARKQYRSYDPGFFGLLGARGGDYFYDDGFLLGYDGNNLAGFVPLLAGALGIGNIWPTSYPARRLPAYYSDYYGLDDERGYRYADNVIYRVEPETAAITSIAALLTGDDITIGQPMPRGYDVYNVPYAYRGRYADGPNARYRYADGYVYEIDPETMLVASAIDLAI
ncbi:hypothetical protein [Erythrobacter sp. MTPC3]|uniref:hypothetical protein n=1 Tax=Erythrobacter sp. MTPC3 TaxID=3056564 RepID=UPI0036F44F1A